MTDESAFHRGLDLTPTDWPLRLVYADWLEEQGRLNEAFAQRWMAQEQKRPRFYHKFQQWVWYDEWQVTSRIDQMSDLTSIVWRLLPEAEIDQGRKAYHTRQEAEFALVQALAGQGKGKP